MVKIKQARKCNVYGKILNSKNKSGLCSHHYKMQYWNKRRKERKEKHLCIMCGAKVKQITKHYAYNLKPSIKTYPVRCPSCQKRQRTYLRKFYYKPEAKERKKQYLQRPNVKERIRQYNQKPEVKAMKKAYRQKPEIKERRRKQRKEQRRKARLIKNKQKT